MNALNEIKNISSVNKSERLDYLSAIGRRYSSSALEMAISESTLKKSQIERILTARGYRKELLKTTTAQLSNQTALNALTASEANAAASTGGLALALKGLSSSVAAFSAAHPVIAFVTALGTVAFGAVGLFDLLTESLDEAQEKAGKSKDVYDGIVSELSSLNSELESTQTRFKELEVLSDAGTITFAEQNELKKLKEQNGELERSIRLKEYSAQIASQKASDDAVNAIGKSVHYYQTDDRTNTTEYASTDRIEALSHYIDRAAKLRETLKSYDAGSAEYKSITKTLTFAENQMKSYYDALDAEDDALRDQYGKIVSGAEDTVRRLNIVYDKMDNYLQNDAVAPEIPEFNTSSFLDSATKIQEEYNKCLQAQQEYNEQGALSASTLNDLISNDLLQYLEFSENGLSLNTSALETNEQALKNNAKAELYNAMCADIRNLALGNTGTLSGIAQNALANLDSAAAAAGENAAIAANGWWEYGASIQSIPGVSDLTGDNAKKATAIINQYKKIAASIDSFSTGKTNSAKKSSGGQTDTDRSAQETMQKAKDYASSYIDYQGRLLDNGETDYNTFCHSVSGMLDDLYRSGKLSAEDYFKFTEQRLTKQFDVYKKALSAVTRRIQEESDKWQAMINAVQEENEALEEKKKICGSVLSAVDQVYEDEIDKINRQKDAIGDVINAMSEENDEYERQAALQQAAYNFNRAMNQKTKMVYKNGQMVWETDDSAIRDSRDELKDAQLNVNIAALEKNQEDLELQIQTLETYKELWAEISNAYQISQDEMNAKALLGQQYAQLVLQNNIADIEAFKNRYVAIDTELQDNTLLIESYGEKVEYYEQLKEQWASIAEAYEIENEKECAAMLLGKDWEKAVLEERAGVLEGFKENYVGLQEQIAQAAENAAERIADAAKRAMASFLALSSAAGGVGTSPIPPAQNPKKTEYSGGGGQTVPHPFHIAQRYASGTANARKGLNLIGENGQELFIDRSGNTSLVTGPTLIPMLGGETVANAFDTKNFLEYVKANPPQFHNPLNGWNTPDLNHVLNNVRNTSAIVNNHVTVNCPNVTDRSGVEYLKRELNSLTTKAMQYNWRK